MTNKGSFKLQSSTHKQDNYLSRGFVGTILGITLLLGVGNVYRAVSSLEQQQLISIPSDLFSSHQYQPIQIGDAETIAQQDFEQIDTFARQLNYSGSSVAELASLLAQHAPTELDKARIIYAWITQHITYDLDAFHDAIENNNYPDINSDKVLEARTTICSGYSMLYQALAEAMDLESAIVIGYAKGATPPDDLRFKDVNHAWNSVKIDGAWYLLDATFGAGTIQNDQFVSEYNPYYFATSPQKFLNKHYPEDSGWQLLSSVVTRAEFDNFPSITTRFYDLNLATVSHHKSSINAANRLQVELKVPQYVIAIAELKQDNLNLPNDTVLVNRQAEKMIINVAPPNEGTYELIIYAKEKDDSNQYGEVIKYQIVANNSIAKLPKVYGQFYKHQASLIEPLSANLAPNWSTYFNLVVPEALDVQVVNTETKQWTALNGYGNYFAGNVDVQSGKTAVVAKFPGDDQYWQLVEYQTADASN